MFVFQLDSTSGVPPYLQLVHQVLIREAVEQLAINPNTVSKAYRQLEHEGLVDPRPGVGTFVARAPAVTVSPAQYAKLRRGLERWLREAEAAGLDEEAVGALLAVVRRGLAEERVA